MSHLAWVFQAGADPDRPSTSQHPTDPSCRLLASAHVMLGPTLAASSTIIRWLWEVLHAMSTEDKQRFLHFATGSDRVPLLGLERLGLVVQKKECPPDRLPTALTCFSRLLLPEYASKEQLRSRLLLAVQNCRGFGLV